MNSDNSRRLRAWSVLGIGAMMLAISLPSITTAHFDPPGPPAILVKVSITGWTTTSNMDDVDFADTAGILTEIWVDYHIVHTGHGHVKDYGVYYYSWLVSGGAMEHKEHTGEDPPVLYSHVECSPMNKIVITFSAKEFDAPQGKTEALGHGGVSFDEPGTKNDTTAGGATKVNAVIEFTVTTEPLLWLQGFCAKK